MSNKDIKATIATTTYKLDTESNEKVLVPYLKDVQNQLKRAYETDKNQFSDFDVKYLKKLNQLIDAFEDLKITEKEILSVKTREDVDSLWLDLNEYGELFIGTLFEKKIRTIQRKLTEKKSTLPLARNKNLFPTKDLTYYEVSNKLKELNKTNNKCPRGCGGYLRARKGVLGVFWGCSKFPKCDYSEDLSEEQNNFLLKK